MVKVFVTLHGFQTSEKINNPNAISVIEENDTNGNYFEIHFANEMPEELTDDDLKLIVDKALTAASEEGKSFTINAGDYNVDRSLGEYGG